MAYSLQIQSVLYQNSKKDLITALESISNAVSVNQTENKEFSDICVCYGDASPAPVLTSQDVSEISERFSKISFRYIFFSENTGTAKGHNRLGKDCTADYMMIMNPDVILSPTIFYALLRPFLTKTDAGIAEARQTPIEHPKEYNKKTFETSWASTACVMFPTKVFQEIGGFDEKTFFMYCDDVDFSWLVRMTGRKIYYCPDAVAFHAKRLSTGGIWQTTSAERYYSAEAALLMAYKWSNDKRVNKLVKVFQMSGDENLQKAAKQFLTRKRQHDLPEQLDRQHRVATFCGDYYTDHRYAL